MKLIDMKMDDYLELLKSDAPAPGGGSVSALSGAQGCALFMMVADLTIGKSKYEDYNHNVPATMKYPLKITERPMPYEAAGCATDDPNQGWGEYEPDDEW
jgi:formiminotetrahydrofolate cyclodeaminase